MYDVGCTMYDLNYSAPEARELYWPAADPEQPDLATAVDCAQTAPEAHAAIINEELFWAYALSI